MVPSPYLLYSIDGLYFNYSYLISLSFINESQREKYLRTFHLTCYHTHANVGLMHFRSVSHFILETLRPHYRLQSNTQELLKTNSYASRILNLIAQSGLLHEGKSYQYTISKTSQYSHLSIFVTVLFIIRYLFIASTLSMLQSQKRGTSLQKHTAYLEKSRLKSLSAEKQRNAVTQQKNYLQPGNICNLLNSQQETVREFEHKFRNSPDKKLNKKPKAGSQNRVKNKYRHQNSQQTANKTKSRGINKRNFVGAKLQKKIQQYFMLLALSSLHLKIAFYRKNEMKYLVYIGKGNNSKLLRKLFYSRHWWRVTSNPREEGINLYWTQWSKQWVMQRMAVSSKLKEEVQAIKPQKSTVSPYSLIVPQGNKSFPRRNKEHESELDIKAYIMVQKLSKPVVAKISNTCNHVQGHEQLTDKKNLFQCYKAYCENKSLNCFDYIPFTFHISNDCFSEDIKLLKTKEAQFLQKEDKSRVCWILKPGQSSNQGNGIRIFQKIDEVNTHIEKCRNSEKHVERTFIIQKYIHPALFHRRKFDIRCFILIVAHPHISAYFYNDMYLRTSSREFSQKKIDDKFIHLTNDAIQKKGHEYGKFEKGNKITIEEYQNYLDLFQSKKAINFHRHILPKIKRIAAMSIDAAAHKLNPSNHAFSFELLGYDFMIDQEFRPQFIEVNTNPCLMTGCPVLDQTIPSLLNNALKLAVDCVFRPQRMQEWPLQAAINFPETLFQPNKFEILYGNIEPKG